VLASPFVFHQKVVESRENYTIYFVADHWVSIHLEVAAAGLTELTWNEQTRAQLAVTPQKCVAQGNLSLLLSSASEKP